MIITTHRPRLVSVADNLLALRNGQQVGFGPADEMINAVRNLQVVAGNKPSDDNANAQEVVAKEATNDAPVATSTHEVHPAGAAAASVAPATPAAPPAPTILDEASQVSAEQKPSAEVSVEGNKTSSGNTPGASL